MEFWDKARIEKLMKLYSNGLHLVDIADTLGTSKEEVIKKVKNLGLSRDNPNYTKLSSNQIADIIKSYPGKSIKQLSVEYKVSTYKIRSILEKSGAQLFKIRWTEEDIDKLRSMADKYPIEYIAEQLKKDKNAVYAKAYKLGIQFKQGRRLWTEEENNYIIEFWGIRTVENIARHLNRSADAVVQQANRLGLKSALQSIELVRLVDFCRYTGMGKDAICNNYAVNKEFPLKRKKMTAGRISLLVDLDEALRWMEKNQSLFDGSKVMLNIFIPEPKWLTDKRKHDAFDKSKLNKDLTRRKWTAREVDTVKALAKMGKTNQEIASRLDRTVSSVARVRAKLYIGDNNSWTTKEIQYIMLNWRLLSDTELAATLGRSLKAVKHQRLKMGLVRQVKYLK